MGHNNVSAQTTIRPPPPTRQYAHIVEAWVRMIGLDPTGDPAQFRIF